MNGKQEIIKPSIKRKTKAKLALQTSVVVEKAPENAPAPAVVKEEPAPKKAKKTPSQSGLMQSFHNLFTKTLVPEEPVVILKEPPANAELVETYTIQAPFSQVNIMSLPELGGGKAYFINEIKLPDDEKALLRKITEIISREMGPLNTTKT